MTDLYPSRCEPDPRILPRLEPVVHGSRDPAAPLTPAQIERFDRDGYLVLHNLFTPEEVAALRESATHILADPTALARETVITEPGGAEVRSVFMIHRQSAVMSRLASDVRLAGLARFLLNDEVYIHQSRLNYKPGFVGKEFYWHSDFETWHVEDGMPRMRALSMSILLAPNSELNGPLMVMPGSHRKYLTCVGETPENHYRSSLKRQEYGVPDPDALAALAVEHGIVAATGQAGTVVIFDCNTMHGSNGNITPFPRANAFFVYNAISNRLLAPFGPKSPRPEFVASRQCMPVLDRPAATLLEAAS
ncbi:MAG: ectoine hydroxylase [Alphaproteobacteria bacterium]|nr:ectoine hydroxylase [Alphaproteobacteria bacterium]